MEIVRRIRATVRSDQTEARTIRGAGMEEAKIIREAETEEARTIREAEMGDQTEEARIIREAGMEEARVTKEAARPGETLTTGKEGAVRVIREAATEEPREAVTAGEARYREAAIVRETARNLSIHRLQPNLRAIVPIRMHIKMIVMIRTR